MTSESPVVLVDTDVMSSVVLPGAVTGRPTRLGGEWIERLTGRSVAIAVQTRVELLIWPLVARWGPERTARLRASLDAVPTVQVSVEVQEAFAELTAAAQHVGHAIHAKDHTGDRWIAATAIAARLPLASNDGIFDDVPGLVRLTDSR